jgi:hypothetical protein
LLQAYLLRNVKFPHPDLCASPQFGGVEAEVNAEAGFGHERKLLGETKVCIELDNTWV